MSLDSRSDPGAGSGRTRYPGTFMLAFREAAGKMGWQVRRWHGSLVECADEHGREHSVGLENLYRRARRQPREQWPNLILDFLRIADPGDFEAHLPQKLADVAERLLVRLGPPMPPMADEARVWSQGLDDTGLCLNLVIDYEERMCYVTEKLIEESGQLGSVWLDKALANLRTRSPAECLEPLDEESDMRLCAMGDAYDSSRALLLDALLPDTVADGCFVAIPSRDYLLVLPVNLQGLQNVHLLKVMAGKNYKTAPYAITDEVIWIRSGVWRPFPIHFKGQEAMIMPPPEFVEVLQRLVPDAEIPNLDDLPGPEEE